MIKLNNKEYTSLSDICEDLLSFKNQRNRMMQEYRDAVFRLAERRSTIQFEQGNPTGDVDNKIETLEKFLKEIDLSGINKLSLG